MACRIFYKSQISAQVWSFGALFAGMKNCTRLVQKFDILSLAAVSLIFAHHEIRIDSPGRECYSYKKLVDANRCILEASTSF